MAPFGAGWAISGTLFGGLTAFLWAGLIRVFERLGWARNVRWPDPGRVERRRRVPAGEPEHVRTPVGR